MSKRKKNRKSGPDLPKATLERARRQARGEDVDEIEEDELEAEEAEEEEIEEEEEPETVAEAAPTRAERRTEPRSSRRRAAPSRAQVSRRREKDAPLDNEVLENMLARPTKIVSEEELQEEYSYVIQDIRNMAILAGGLLVVLVILSQFI